MEPETIIKQALGSRYEIQSVIGKGGMATVYKAIQTSLNRPVALKVIHQNLVHDKEFIDRFLREAQVCASLNHPNIVTIYDVGSVDTVHYISMEYLEGMTLRELVVSKRSLNANDTAKYIAPVADALGLMHKRGIIHRDVKSSNIFVTKSDRVVLMDFGIVLSEERDPLSHSGTILGTPEYMSPEQAEGKIRIDGRSDIYSLGVILFECLTGTLPFHSDNYLTTLHHVIHDAPPSVTVLNPDAHTWISKIVSACLVKNREIRIPDGETLAKSLRAKQLVNFGGTTYDQLTRKISLGEIKLQTERQNTIDVPPDKQKKLLLAIIVTVTLIIIILGILILNPSQSGSSGGGPVNYVKGNRTIQTSSPSGRNIKATAATQQAKTKSDPEAEKKDNIARLTATGDQQASNGLFESAITSYNEAMKLDPGSISIRKKITDATTGWINQFISRGDNYLNNKDFEKAADAYNNAKKLDPGNNLITEKLAIVRREQINSLVTLGDSQMRSQDYAGALAEYQKAQNLEPSNAAIAGKISKAQTEIKNYEIQQSKLNEQRRKAEAIRNLGIEMILVENSQTGTFYMGKTEVNQRLWKTIMGTNPSTFQGDNLPVESVSWIQIQQFIQKLNQKTGADFRLPSQREWETAAAGRDLSLKYSGSNVISEVAWYEANSGSKTHPVMQLRPNQMGFADMSGNVWEYCSDRSIKGGCWMSTSTKCSITGSGTPDDNGNYTIGFRLCRTPE